MGLLTYLLSPTDPPSRVQGLGFRVQGLGRVYRVQGFGFRVQGLGVTVWDLGFRDFGCRVQDLGCGIYLRFSFSATCGLGFGIIRKLKILEW